MVPSSFKPPPNHRGRRRNMSMLEHTLILTLSYQYGVPLKGEKQLRYSFKNRGRCPHLPKGISLWNLSYKLPQPPQTLRGLPRRLASNKRSCLSAKRVRVQRHCQFLNAPYGPLTIDNGLIIFLCNYIESASYIKK